MNVLDLLDRPIAFHRPLVTITGSINAALMLGQAIYWTNRSSLPDGWFYKSATDWESEIGLTRHQQDKAREILEPYLEAALHGVPATVHFRVKSESLAIALKNTVSQFAGKRQTGLRQIGKLDCHKPANLSAGNRQTVLIGTKNTQILPQNGELSSILENQLRTIFEIFRRRPTTELNKGEQRAWDTLTNKGKRPLHSGDLEMVASFYKAHWPPRRDHNALRHALESFLNNFNGEVDKARPWYEKRQHKNGSNGSNGTKSVQLTEAPISDDKRKELLAQIKGLQESVR